jgi:predicted  nucleic acid-binding Zn-ribbon protein
MNNALGRKWRQMLNDKAREVMNLLSTVNELEKTVSRLKNELTEEYEKIDEALDRNGK